MFDCAHTLAYNCIGVVSVVVLRAAGFHVFSRRDGVVIFQNRSTERSRVGSVRCLLSTLRVYAVIECLHHSSLSLSVAAAERILLLKLQRRLLDKHT